MKDISNIIRGKLVLAPMAGVTNLPFRILCRRYGASLVCTEMINANALSRGNKATERLTETCDEEKPVSFQLFGTKEENFVESIKFIEEKADIIDINMGCPVAKIIKQGAGVALLKRPEKVKRLVSAVVQATKKPVSVKIRISSLENTIKIAKTVEDAGAALITIHARTAQQGYSGKVDWGIVRKTRRELNIPVIGNGGIIDEKSAEKYKKCADYLMIGKAAIGNPYIFTRLNEYLQVGRFIPQMDKIELFNEFYKLTEKYPIKETDFKTQALWFTKGIKNSTDLRNNISKAKTKQEILEIFEKEKN
ncbi:tRNA-dihydrouridine synthase family protein [Candidatus Woesearchaeota archaeon]|nr:tRNA-dihydrouridine synthase family protein [Candidatus Woesearchaeota archaeon]